MKTGLLRIILIDAYMGPRRNEFRVGRHANISGTNGAGKTTLLKLIPFFYGAEPAKLSARSHNHRGFVDWYLPRPTSLIIFEYQGTHRKNCVVVYRHSSGDKPAYRLLASPFDIDLFSEDSANGRMFIEAASLPKHWVEHGIDHTRQIEQVVDYRAIIQNDRGSVQRSGASKDLHTMAAQYSIGSKLGAMKHIDKIALSILDRSGNMENIRLMLADIMRDEGVEIPTLKLHKDIPTQIANIKTLREFEKNLPDINKTIQRAHEYAEIQIELDNLSGELSAIIEIQRTSIDKTDRALDALETDLHVLNTSWENEKNQLEANLSTAKVEFGEKDETVTRLHNKYAEWEEMDIESRVADVGRLDAFESDLENARQRVETLTSAVSELRAKSDERKSTVDKSHYAEQQRISREKQRVEQERRANSESTARRREENQRQHNAERDLVREQWAPGVEELIRQQAAAQTNANQSAPTDEEALRREVAEQDLDQKNQAAEQAQKHVDAADQHSRKALRAFEDAERKWNSAKQIQDDALQQLEQLREWAAPQKDTFLAQLRMEHPQWHETIGRVINMDVLARNDLDPVRVDESQTLFGWQIHHQVIPKSDLALSAEALEQRIEDQEAVFARAREHASDMEVLMGKAGEERAAADKAKQEAETTLAAAKRHAGAARDALRIIREEISQAVARRRNEAKTNAAELTKKLQTYREDLANAVNEVTEREKEAAQEITSNYALEDSRLGQQLDGLTREEKYEAEKYKATLNEIEADYTKACAKEGIDEATLKSADAAVKVAREVLERVQSYKKSVRAYQAWLEESWSTREALAAQRAHALSVQSACEGRLQTRTDETIEARKKLTGRRTDLQRDKRTFSSILEECTTLQRRIGVQVTASVNETPRPYTTVIALATSAMDSRDELKIEINSGVDKAERMIGRHPESQIYAAWGVLRTEMERTAASVTPDQLRLSLALQLQRLVSDNLPQAKRTMIGYVRSTGNQLTQFYNSMKNISSAIAGQSRRISGSINQTMRFDALADMEVRLVSRIESQDYWDALEQFQQQWLLWQDDSDTSLPPAELDEALVSAAQAIQNARLLTSMDNVFDLEIALTENGRRVVAKSAKDLEQISSVGLSYLVLCSLFAGISRMLCQDSSVLIHWPVDELGNLSPENIGRLFKMLDDNNIVMVSGFPTSEPTYLRLFMEHHDIDPKRGVVEVIVEDDALSGLLRQRTAEAVVGE